MKKVLHIITKLELGGAQKSTLDILNNLDRARYKVFLISSDGLLSDAARRIASLDIKILPSLKREINPLFDLKALIDLYLFIKRNKIDIVHTHSSKAGILGRFAAYFANVPVIIHTIHGWSFNDRQNIFTRSVFIILERISAGMTTRLISVCKADIEKGLANKIGYRSQYQLVYYGIDFGQFNDIQLNKRDGRRCLGLKEDAFTVGMIACFKPQKAHQDFIRAASLLTKKIPDIQFLLIGDGALRSKIVKRIRRFGLADKFILAGFRRDIPQLLSILDMVALSSHWEGLPITLLEAQAAGLAVVATDVGGISEIIQERKNGFLVKSREPKQLAERIAFLANNRSLCLEMGRFAQGSLDKTFEVNTMVKQIDSIYESLMKG